MDTDFFPHILHCLVNSSRSIGTKGDIQYQLFAIFFYIAVSIFICITSCCQALFCLLYIISLAFYIFALIIAYAVRECFSKSLCVTSACDLCNDIAVNGIRQGFS